MKKLLENFNELKELPFPGSCESDALADWITNLAEIDGYYFDNVKLEPARHLGSPKYCGFIDHQTPRLHRFSDVREKDGIVANPQHCCHQCSIGNLTLSSYVGKVISSLNGGKREFINCEYLELLRKQLEDITELPEEDEEIFQACENYLEALASIAL